MIFLDNTGYRQRALLLFGICVGFLLLASIIALSVAALVDPQVQPPWPETADRTG